LTAQRFISFLGSFPCFLARVGVSIARAATFATIPAPAQDPPLPKDAIILSTPDEQEVQYPHASNGQITRKQISEIHGRLVVRALDGGGEEHYPDNSDKNNKGQMSHTEHD
jgi:hypothetical protein